MIIVHRLSTTRHGGYVAEFYVGRETAQKLEVLPIPYQETIERDFEEKVDVEFARWQETMV